MRLLVIGGYSRDRAGRYPTTTVPALDPGMRIAHADVAHCIVGQQADPEHVRKTVVLTGA